ncbi:MAG: phosphatase PAP2 family protein [Candidatus Eiseniibacteriota bacterium]|jgi:membrane-associated phospholipid phosphatase
MLLPWLVLLLIPLAILLAARRRHGAPHRPAGAPAMRELPRLLRRHHSRRNFLRLGLAVAGAAVLAYGGVDARVDRWHAAHVRGRTAHTIADLAHFLGERPWVLYWLLFALIDAWWATNPLTRWGRRCFDATLIGLPGLWVVQRGLGASRPRETPHGPRFHPLADDNSASGHTFIAAVPFLVAARMSHRMPARSIAYALSPVTGWSRIHDRKHYLSQVALGYGLAWQAVDTVMTEPPRALPAHTPTVSDHLETAPHRREAGPDRLEAGRDHSRSTADADVARPERPLSPPDDGAR